MLREGRSWSGPSFLKASLMHANGLRLIFGSRCASLFWAGLIGSVFGGHNGVVAIGSRSPSSPEPRQRMR